MRIPYVALAIPFVVFTAQAQSWKLKAVDSVSISRNSPHVFNDNRLRAYNYPTSTYRDIHGAFRFDVSSIPNNVTIKAMRLTLYMENRYSSPRGNPVVNLHHSPDDKWTRATATPASAALGKVVTAGQKNFVHPKHVFTIDVKAHDFSTDLKDDAITLVIDNVNPAYSYVYFFGHTGSPSGPNAELEIDACPGSALSYGTGGKDCSNTTHTLAMTGCPTPGQRVDITATVGQTIRLPLLLFMGASDQRWGAFNLPFDLTPLGAPGNRIYASLDIGLGTIPNNGGGGKITLPIPNASGLKNVTVFFQSIIFNCGANQLRLVFSNGVRMTIG